MTFDPPQAIEVDCGTEAEQLIEAIEEALKTKKMVCKDTTLTLLCLLERARDKLLEMENDRQEILDSLHGIIYNLRKYIL